MDKRTPRWRNVPSPNQNTQLTLIGTCFAINSDGNLCAELESISLPPVTPTAASFPTPGRDMSVKNRRKFAARAPAKNSIRETKSSQHNQAALIDAGSQTYVSFNFIMNNHPVNETYYSSKKGEDNHIDEPDNNQDALVEINAEDAIFRDEGHHDDPGPSTRAKNKRKLPC